MSDTKPTKRKRPASWAGRFIFVIQCNRERQMGNERVQFSFITTVCRVEQSTQIVSREFYLLLGVNY